MSKTIYQSHHIIPKYILRKLGLPDDWMGEDNRIDLTRLEHAEVHYDRWLRGGRVEDLDAAQLLARGEIEGIDTSGKNNGFYGKHHTPETRKMMSVSSKGQVPWMKGKKHTEEANQKNREAHLGKRHTPEAKLKMRNSTLGMSHFMPEEAKKKISEWHRTHKHITYKENAKPHAIYMRAWRAKKRMEESETL